MMKEERHTIASEALGNKRTLWISHPKEKEGDLNLLIILDAEIYRERVGAPAILEELYARKEIAPSLVVYVSSCDVEARWRECPCYPPFAVFVKDELLPWVENRYPEARYASKRVIVGLSYTGLAASYVAMKSKGLFSKVVSQSGSYWSNDCWLVGECSRSENWLPAAHYLDVGSEEREENVQHKEDVIQVVSQIEGVERFRDALLSQGGEVEYRIFEGNHSAEGWRSTLPDALKWALPASW